MSSFPNLLIIGAMKGGTTSLHDYLSKHPDIFMSNPKEIHYYDDANKITEEEYLSYFQTNRRIRGTTPQSYSKAHYNGFKNIPEKIFQDTPNVKLIYIVRDPFERMLSHALENRYGDDLPRINENSKSGHYWKTSLYHYQITEYLKFFDKSQIHILTLESLKINKLKELNKIFRFLGVHELSNEKVFDYVKNDAFSKDIPLFVKSKFWFRFTYKLSKTLAEKIAIQVIKKRYENYLRKPKLASFIDEEQVAMVREDALRLEKDFMVDISDWNLNPKIL
jgi:hypothetical protein